MVGERLHLRAKQTRLQEARAEQETCQNLSRNVGLAQPSDDPRHETGHAQDDEELVKEAERDLFRCCTDGRRGSRSLLLGQASERGDGIKGHLRLLNRDQRSAKSPPSHPAHPPSPGPPGSASWCGCRPARRRRAFSVARPPAGATPVRGSARGERLSCSGAALDYLGIAPKAPAAV